MSDTSEKSSTRKKKKRSRPREKKELTNGSRFLIAEISNCHLGNLDRAKELIKLAKESGADAVKSVAYEAKDFRVGSMPTSFYTECQFNPDQYEELLQFGDDNNIPVFFTILSKSLLFLAGKQKYQKLAKFQFDKTSKVDIRKFDSENVFISTAYPRPAFRLEKAKILFVTKYEKTVITPFEHSQYQKVLKWNIRPIGLSDHTQGIDGAREMLKTFYLPVIEKHFHQGDEIVFDGRVYRDSLHAARPKDFEELAKEYKG